MYNTFLLGVDNNYTPLSSAFCIETLNENFLFDKEIKSISKLTFSVQGEYADSFCVLEDNYVNIYYSINIKADYISIDNSLNYKICSVHKLLNICTEQIKCNQNISLSTQIIDAGILSIQDKDLSLYIAIVCSLSV